MYYQAPVSILSLSSDDQMLLVGYGDEHHLYVYTTSGTNVSTIKMRDEVQHAAWAPRRHHVVVITAVTSGNNVRPVQVMSVKGDVLSSYRIYFPRYVSVSTDKVIYVCAQNDVFQSNDDGMTWTVVAKTLDPRKVTYEYAIRVPAATGSNSRLLGYSQDVTWAITQTRWYNLYRYRLSICTSNKYSNGNEHVTWRDVILPTSVNVEDSKLAFDGNASVYMINYRDWSVHVMSASGLYEGQVLSAEHFDSKNPFSLTVDGQRRVMYIGQQLGVISVFTLL